MGIASKELPVLFFIGASRNLFFRRAAGRAARMICKSCVSAPLEIFQFLQDHIALLCSLIFSEEGKRSITRGQGKEDRKSVV